MEFEQILKLIDHVSASHLESFCYEGDGMKLSLNNKIAPVIVAGMQGQTVTAPVNEAVTGGGFSSVEIGAGLRNMEKAVAENSVEKSTDANDHEEVFQAEPSGNVVKSPLVGTFYAAPSEDAAPFVKIGDKVKKGQVLAIVEAMKLMNDIESDFDGEIAEIYVENGQPVEYGQPLFCIR